MRILNETLLSGGDVSGSLTSVPLLLAYAYGYSVQAVFTGAPAGTITLQGSSDPVPNAQGVITSPTNWATISGTSTVISASGATLFNASGIYYNWVRLVFTVGGSPGTGTLTVVGSTKGT